MGFLAVVRARLRLSGACSGSEANASLGVITGKFEAMLLYSYASIEENIALDSGRSLEGGSGRAYGMIYANATVCSPSFPLQYRKPIPLH